jgi:hypothetical protein
MESEVAVNFESLKESNFDVNKWISSVLSSLNQSGINGGTSLVEVIHGNVSNQPYKLGLHAN